LKNFPDQHPDEYIGEHRLKAAEILESILNGSDREKIEAEIATISDEDLEDWLFDYADRKTTSMNDIGGAARAYAAKLRKNEAEAGDRND
jgi:hypothetical protein